MNIVSQNRRRTINYNRVIDFYIEYNKEEKRYYIKCKETNGDIITVAKYQSQKQANTVKQNLDQALALQGQSVVLENGMVQYNLPMYYMPEEKKEDN